MAKYKVGDRFIVEIIDTTDNNCFYLNGGLIVHEKDLEACTQIAPVSNSIELAKPVNTQAELLQKINLLSSMLAKAIKDYQICDKIASNANEDVEAFLSDFE